MCRHEEKYCPRCHSVFECKVGNILQCQCYPVQLTDEERQFVNNQFQDCLCSKCLLEIKDQFEKLPKPVPLPNK